MGLRLKLLSWWTPEFVIRKELAYVADHTIMAIETILASYGNAESVDIKQQMHLTAELQRANMARTHVKLVETLVAAFGHEKGVTLGRETLFSIGESLGKQTSARLGVGDNPKDMVEAAKILYRIFGIEFHVEWLDDSKTNATLIIDRCALAEHYTPLTCEVLSATDEGIIQGLQPNSKLQFKEYMTSDGCTKCKADIHFHKEIKR
jgi:hypothetical protein